MWLNTRGARGARLAALACGWFAAWLITPAALAATQDCRAVTPETCAVAHGLRRGVNLGNMLEAPREGDWGGARRARAGRPGGLEFSDRAGAGPLEQPRRAHRRRHHR